jgi:hypothetical protein
MAETSAARPTGLSRSARPAVVAAAVGSAAAGLVHAAAAGGHQGDSLLMWMFSACAAAQLGWGWAVATASRPRRSLLLAGLVINGGAFLVWAASRTVGIGFIDSLKVPEEVGRQDLAAALFAAVSVAAVVCILVRPAVRTVLAPGWPAAVAVCAFVLVLPALAAGHEHSHEAEAHEHVTAGADHDHASAGHEGDAADHSHTEVAAADAHDHATDATGATEGAHDHGTATTSATGGHDHSGDSTHTDTESTTPHEHDDPTTSTTVPHDHDPGPGPDPGPPITSLDDPRLTPEQVQAAVGLIVATMNGLPGSLTEADVVAAGYQSIGDGGHPGEYEHFVNWPYLSDTYELDAGHIESIVMKMNADGTKRVVAAMYSLTFGDTMANVPAIAGGLTTWHDHDNMCFAGDQFVGLATSGGCSVGALRDTPPMLHVWIEENPCGPFAVIDNQPHECTGGHTH